MSIHESARGLGLKTLLGCTAYASMKAPEYDDYKRAQGETDHDVENTFGMCFPFLQTLYTSDGLDEGEGYNPDLEGAEPMHHDDFVLLNEGKYAELFKVGITVSVHIHTTRRT